MANLSEDLVKVTYVDNSTVIGATNLNDIQDAIIEMQDVIEDYGNVAELSYTVVSTF